MVLAVVARLYGQTWSFIVSMSSYLTFIQSLSLGVLTCLLVVVFLFRRYLPSFVLRRHASGLLVCLWFPLCLLPELLCRLLASPLDHSCPPLQGVGHPPSGEGRSRSHAFCGYCNRPGHPESDCHK